MPSKRLRPGQPVDREAFNKLADQLERKMRSAVGIAVHDGQMGAGLTPDRALEPVWGVILENGPASSPDFFAWKQVYPANDGTFQLVEDSEDFAGGYKSQKASRSTSPYDEILLNPAVEINGGSIGLNTIVRLIPTRVIVDADGNVHRAWLFSNPHGLRPFKLTADLIPTGGTDPDLTIAAEWLDDPGEEVTLYPVHRSGWPSGDQFISLGVGRGPGAYFRGTYGWAQFQPKGTIIGLDAAGDPVWRPEWQIVTLYAETLLELQVTGTGKIGHGENGEGELYWIDKHRAAERSIGSGYTLKFFNDQFVDLAPDDFVRVEYNRNRAIWVAVHNPIPSGVTIYQSAGQATTAAYVDVFFDRVMQDTDVEDLKIGLHIERDGKTIKNTSERDIYGTASWQICAQRNLNPLPIATGPDAYCQCALFNDGNLVAGTESRSTSSRRRDVLGSAKAVNTNSGTVLCKIKAGEAIAIRIRHQLNIDADDTFDTVPEHSHFTFIEIQGAAVVTP